MGRKMTTVVPRALRDIEHAWTEMKHLQLHTQTHQGNFDIRLTQSVTEEDTPELLQIKGSMYNALRVLMEEIESLYDEIWKFVTDPNKDPNLRQFIWFRVFLPAQAYEISSSMHSSLIGLDKLMPRVVFGPANEYEERKA
jgi:hypothetical protein